MVGPGALDERRSGTCHRAGRTFRAIDDDGVDESRGVGCDGGRKAGHLLVAVSPAPVAKGGAIRSRAESQEIRLDCDHDAVLLLIEQVGGIACHTGRESCFFQRLDDKKWIAVDPVIRQPEEIYNDV